MPPKSQLLLFISALYSPIYSSHWLSTAVLTLPASLPHLNIVVRAAVDVLDDNCFCDLLKILTIFRSGRIKSLRSLGISLFKIIFNLPMPSSLSTFLFEYTAIAVVRDTLCHFFPSDRYYLEVPFLYFIWCPITSQIFLWLNSLRITDTHSACRI